LGIPDWSSLRRAAFAGLSVSVRSYTAPSELAVDVNEAPVAPRPRVRIRFESLGFVLAKLPSAGLLLLAVITVNFVLIHLAPGDPVSLLIGETDPTPEQLQALHAQLGLDRPLPVQYFTYLWSVLHGNLGESYVLQDSVLTLILDRVPATVSLMFSSLVIFTVLGTLLAMRVATRPASRGDALGSLLGVLGYSMPAFWLGQIVLLWLALRLRWFPTSGMTDARYSLTGAAYWLDLLHHMALPAFVLGMRYLAINFRFARASMRDALSQDYIVAARAKGLPERRVVFHAFRNGVLPLITVFGLNVSDIMAGAVLTEIVFGWPGLGRLMYDAMNARDYPVLMGMFLFISAGIILTNLAVDIVYGLFDPRVRLR
jgi:ABC-type dipeptide/oligopeptide/nickel transport system permease component